MNRAQMLLALLVPAALSGGCGEDPCPAGTTAVGDTCVSVDGGPPPDGDAGPSDGGGADACAPTTFFRDGDGDGYGSAAEPMEACALPDGYVADDTDCDDGAMAVYPGADEVCNGEDDDCDGYRDEGLMGPVGAPLAIGTGADDIVAIDAYSGGYVAAWHRDDGLVVTEILDPTGASLRAAESVRSPMFTDAPDSPALAVVEPASHAVVAWAESGEIHARSIGLEGAVSPVFDTVSLSGFAPQVVAAADEAIVLWVDNGPPRRIIARRFHAETGVSLGGASEVFAWEDPPPLLIFGAAYVAGPSPYLLVAAPDLRTGDTVHTAYVARVPLPALMAEPTALRIEPSGADGTLAVWPTAAVGSPAAPMALTASGPADAFFLEAAPLTASGALALDGSLVALEPPGFPSDIATTAEGATITYVERGALDGATTRVWGVEVGPGRVPVAVPAAWTSTPAYVWDAAVARRGPAEGAVLTSSRTTAGGTTNAIELQLLGCE